MGPIEIFPTATSEGCRTVRPTSRKGAAIIYRSTTFHRGTSNAGDVARPSIDSNFMLPESALAYDYFNTFLPRFHVLDAMQEHNARFVRGCTAAGLACEPFSVPLRDVEREEEFAFSFDDMLPSIVTFTGTLIAMTAWTYCRGA